MTTRDIRVAVVVDASGIWSMVAGKDEADTRLAQRAIEAMATKEGDEPYSIHFFKVSVPVSAMTPIKVQL